MIGILTTINIAIFAINSFILTVCGLPLAISRINKFVPIIRMVNSMCPDTRARIHLYKIFLTTWLKQKYLKSAERLDNDLWRISHILNGKQVKLCVYSSNIDTIRSSKRGPITNRIRPYIQYQQENMTDFLRRIYGRTGEEISITYKTGETESFTL